jgi:SNF2 family DNA or RNA helicase
MEYYVKPWDHQLKAIELSKTLNDMALFWEMGVGKTSAMINILRHRYETNGKPMRTIIFCPLVVAENWREEIGRHSKIERVFVLRGSGYNKLTQIQRVGTMPCVLIANYEVMQNKAIVEELTNNFRPEIVVCDESQRCKSITSKRAKAIAKLAEGAKARFLLSGTPILNSPMDIYQQYLILDNGETFGKNFYAFRAALFHDKNAHMPAFKHFPDWQPKPGALARLTALISQKALRIKKEECLDLPPMVYLNHHIEMGRDQARAYKEMRDDFITFLHMDHKEPQAVVANMAMTKALKLQQIISGFAITADGDTISFDDNPRQAALKELLEDLTPDHKVIVWACFKENYRQVRRVCDELKVKFTELHGEIKDKDASIRSFRTDNSCRVIIANPASAGLGVNLVEASYSIYFSKNFSLENDVQSEARNHRGGSEIHKKITRIDLIAKDTIDEKVTEALKKKENIAEKILSWRL